MSSLGEESLQDNIFLVCKIFPIHLLKNMSKKRISQVFDFLSKLTTALYATPFLGEACGCLAKILLQGVKVV